MFALQIAWTIRWCTFRGKTPAPIADGLANGCPAKPNGRRHVEVANGTDCSRGATN